MIQIIGIILIAVVLDLYILWIFYTKNQSGTESISTGDIQEFDILVKGGYSPSVITAKINLPVKINFLRQEKSECSHYVVFSDFKIRKELPENKTVSIEFTPKSKGDFGFTCDMGMYQGKLIVK